jgi:hypothetical protein
MSPYTIWSLITITCAKVRKSRSSTECLHVTKHCPDNYPVPLLFFFHPLVHPCMGAVYKEELCFPEEALNYMSVTYSFTWCLHTILEVQINLMAAVF